MLFDLSVVANAVQFLSKFLLVRFQVLTAASMFRIVFWDVLPPSSGMSPSLMMEVVRTSETSVDNHFTRQYIPEDNSEQIPPVCATCPRIYTDCSALH
jgi:hypothetical protein